MFGIKLSLVLTDHIFTSIFKEEHVSKPLEIDYIDFIEIEIEIEIDRLH